WAAGRDEAVEVNQRALIDKVLARYSGEFTVFRELLQNSDDAGANSVEIRFETQSYLFRVKQSGVDPDKSLEEDLPNLKTAVVHQWTFKNNGTKFRDEDWNRLKKIAEGNPDEEKIGAFGVGFYSLFSVTEEPWVISGGQWMNFYWKDKKDQLYVRRGPTPPDENVDPWTTFQMTLREPGPMPPAFDFTRFLVSSITFMAHLSEVSIYFDDQRLVRLSKRGDGAIEVPMLVGLDSKTPDGRMTVRSVQTIRLHIEAEVARSVYTVESEKRLARRTDTSKVLSSKKKLGGFLSLFSGGPSRRSPTPAPAALKQPINLLGAVSSSVVLTIFTANVDVRLDKKMTAELLRATKKTPPSRLRYELTYMEKDQYDSSVKAEERAAHATGSVFRGLRADLEGQVATGSARVFIGHSTGQTTGIGGHMATRFIPTVEREAIDLVDRNVAVWNKGLLHVGGFLARFAYEHEMEIIKKEWDAAVAADSPGGLPDTGLQAWLRARALHALKFFTFRPSTPSPVVSTSMQAAFFACAIARPFSIISSEGVRSSSLVYIPHPDFSGFLKRLPVISEDVVNGANITIAALRARKMIKNIEFEDVLNELHSRPLSETETVACLKWWIDKGGKNNLQRRSQLLDALMVSINGPPERIMKLSDARTFLNATTGGGIPADGPLPGTLLPTSVTGSFDPDVLGTVFPWKQLTIVEWLKHIADPRVAAVNAEFDITLSVSWAERVLLVLARAWLPLPESAKEDIIKVLKAMPCVPTSAGLKVPDQAYFASANLNMFSDLPIVALPSDASIKEILETVLQSLGVHKHADLQIIFERMIRTGDWTIPEFVKYLVSIQSDLTLRVLKDLRGMTAFPKEGTLEGTDKGPSAPTTSSEVQLQRYKIMDLYEPVDIFRELGLPIIDWGVDNTWERTSDEAKFLFSLGLKRFLPLSELLNITASNNQTVREKALTFFLDNLSVKYSDYDPDNYRDLAFVPALRGSEKVLAKPFELYASPKWATLGFLVVDPLFRGDAARKLKLNSHPPTSKIMTLLKRSPPIDETTARQWFEVLSDHVRVFSLEELRTLSETPFVPVQSRRDKGVIQRLSPRGCYFAGIGVAELHAKLFSFVDFGSRANEFLAACGTKKEPSVEEIAQILLADPRKFYELANGREHYLVELRNIAVYKSLLVRETIDRMKQSNVLLGLRRVKRSGGRSSNEDDEDHWVLQDDLLRPNNVVIADDTDAYQLFGDRIFCAPQEDILEELYLLLGSPRLTSLVREDCNPTVEIPSSTIGPEIRHLILERLPLLLHGHPQPLTEVKTKVSFDWLNEDMNFVVKVFENLQFTTSLRHGDVHHFETREASAFATRDGQGPIEFWLAGNTPVDMHEVSTSLSRFIFESPRANDIISFMTILSTNIETLKRWGYNVNRILRRQKAERKAAKSAETTRPPFPNDLPYQGSKIVTLLERSPPIDETTARQWFEVLSDRVPGAVCQPSLLGTTSPIMLVVFSPEDLRRLSETPFVPVKSTGSEGVIQRLSPKRCPHSPNSGGLNVTPLSTIDKNIEMAIGACVPVGSNQPRIHEETQIVRESLHTNCYDVSDRGGKFKLVGTIGGVKVFAAEDLPESESIVQHKHDVLTRFLLVLNPLVAIYKIPQSSLNILAANDGLIAFNRNGSLFVNLRYFEAWHDRDVQRADFSKAYISWYLTLAHEIAHNLVRTHDSVHEFYFSAICGAYFVALSKLLR
ncbi:hypothetical protein EDB92DRAFT_1804081, partial [Lactarius akahatsu]